MNNNNKPNSNMTSFTGLGLIFGTALGAAFCIIISINIIWAGVGTAVGLIWGAIIDNRKSGK
ncbi:MAG: hypothetical protein CVU91_04255 [Firmicutes bacterium HGW-Firmicutes-16]|nr:MAG: hypothetical protein CVU91_04255 [Firmicutes bacterium HGW-Firmicutes-16]